MQPAVAGPISGAAWQEHGGALGAQVTQAVPTMLELVPPGGDKWAGLQQLVQHLGISTDQVMACGDGGNDLTLVLPGSCAAADMSS